jgi:hypothetical protein
MRATELARGQAGLVPATTSQDAAAERTFPFVRPLRESEAGVLGEQLAGELAPAVDIGLLKDSLEVVLDRVRGDMQLFRDRCCAQPL